MQVETPGYLQSERLRIGSQLVDGRLHLVEVLGQGGMGIVYRAFDAERHAHVALKTMTCCDPVGIYAFKKEFRALADVHHPNLVRLYELFSDEGRWFFTMELVEGERFDTWVRPAPCFDPRRVHVGFSQLLEAIDAIHAAGKLHRDLKPNNVLVTDDGHLTVLDFGLVAEPKSSVTEFAATDDGLAGTPAYLAPELVLGCPATPASDLYAVGVMLFEAMTGQAPFVGSVGEILVAKQRVAPLWPQAQRRQLPAHLVELCDRLLERDPSRRPELHALREYFSNGRTPRRKRVTHAPSTSAELVGRDAELERLQSAYRATLSGKMVVLAVCGESGVGKTALCTTFVDDLAREGHAIVVRGRCRERESVPFKAFDALVDDLSRYLRRQAPEHVAAVLPRDCVALTTLFPVLARIDAFAHAPGHTVGDPQEQQRRAFAAFHEMLGRLRDRTPLVLYIDDLQWCDRDSAHLLRHLLRAEDLPVLLLVSHQLTPHSEDELTELVWRTAHLNAGVELHQLALQRLSADAAAQLAARLLGPVACDALVQRIEQEARGSPLLIGEFAPFVAEAGQTSTLTLCDSVNARLLHVSDRARFLLSLVAVSGRPEPLELALASGATQTDIDALSHARLIRTQRQQRGDALAFYHDQLHARYRATIAADDARACYAALARACRGLPHIDVALRYEYFHGAGEVNAAASCAIEAADRSCAALAFDHAAELYAKALELTIHDASSELTLRTKYAAALASAGRSAEAADAYERAAELAVGHANLELRHRSAEQWLNAGQPRRGFELLRAVCAEIGIELPPRKPSALATAWTLGKAKLATRAIRPLEPRAISPREALRLEAAHTAVIGLRYFYLPPSATLMAYEYLAAAQRSGDARNQAWALASVVMLTPLDSRNQERFARFETLCTQDGRPELIALLCSVRGFNVRRRGDLREARRWFARAQRAVQDCAGAHWQHLDALLVYDQATAATLGDFADLVATTPALVEEAFQRGRVWTGANLSGVFGMPAWLARDDSAGYRRALDDARRRWGQPLGSDFDRTGYLLLRAEVIATIYEGDPLGALRLVDRRTDSPAATPTGLLSFLRMACSAAALARANALRLSPTEVHALRERLADRTSLKYVAYAGPFAGVFEAALALDSRDIERAIALLRVALRRFDRGQIGMHAAATRRRLGQLLGGDEGRELVRAADAFMQKEGVVNLDAMTEIHCPGCTLGG